MKRLPGSREGCRCKHFGENISRIFFTGNRENGDESCFVSVLAVMMSDINVYRPLFCAIGVQ